MLHDPILKDTERIRAHRNLHPAWDTDERFDFERVALADGRNRPSRRRFSRETSTSGPRRLPHKLPTAQTWLR